MANFDLSDYNLAELKGLLFDVGNAIRARLLEDDRERIAAARSHAQEIARQVGLSLDDLVDPVARRKTAD